MKDGYTKTAMVLQNLDATDRHWLLEQLQPEDRARVTAVLAQLTEAGPIDDQRVAAAIASRESDRKVAQHAVVADTDQRLLMRAKLEDIELMLADEPDWIVALLLAHSDWPWAPAFLEWQTAETVERLSTLSQQLSAVVKLRVSAEIVRVCIARLPHTQPVPVTHGSFASLLAGIRQRPADTHATDTRT